MRAIFRPRQGEQKKGGDGDGGSDSTSTGKKKRARGHPVPGTDTGTLGRAGVAAARVTSLAHRAPGFAGYCGARRSTVVAGHFPEGRATPRPDVSLCGADGRRN